MTAELAELAFKLELGLDQQREAGERIKLQIQEALESNKTKEA